MGGDKGEEEFPQRPNQWRKRWGPTRANWWGQGGRLASSEIKPVRKKRWPPSRKLTSRMTPRWVQGGNPTFHDATSSSTRWGDSCMGGYPPPPSQEEGGGSCFPRFHCSGGITAAETMLSLYIALETEGLPGAVGSRAESSTMAPGTLGPRRTGGGFSRTKSPCIFFFA